VLAQRMSLPGGLHNYGAAMAIVAACVFASVFVLSALGYLIRKENRALNWAAREAVS
jgi:hypothetical protein